MRYRLIPLAFLCLLGACGKQETATKTVHYKQVIYVIESGDSNLLVNFPRAVYDEVQKGNIAKDSILPAPGSYSIRATVLNEEIALYGESKVSDNFRLQIVGEGNVVLVQTDTIEFIPANVLAPAVWRAQIKTKP